MDQLDILKMITAKGTLSIAENISENTIKKSLILFLEEETLWQQLIKVKENFLSHTYQQQRRFWNT